MSIPAFSPAWADALLAAVSGNGEYREAASSWSNPVALVVEPGADIPLGAAVQVALDAGVCLSAQSLHPRDVTAPFVLTAALSTWKDILAGGTDPFTAVARGAVRLTRGSMFTLMLNARGARALLTSAQGIDTLWP